MQYSTVTHKGQVTIPISIRKEFGIQEGDKVVFVKLGNSISITVAHKADLSELFGCLPKPDRAIILYKNYSFYRRAVKNGIFNDMI